MSNAKSYSSHPWRRFFARMLDIQIYFVISAIIFDLIFHIYVGSYIGINFIGPITFERGGYSISTNLGISTLSIVIMLFVEPLLLCLFKTTAGKFVWGIRVTKNGGSRLSYAEGLKRTWGVVLHGMGLNIPFYSVYRLYVSYRKCRNDEIDWDDNSRLKVSPRIVLCIIFYIVASFAISNLGELYVVNSSTPPNTSSISVTEFAENYRHYTDYMGYGESIVNIDDNGVFSADNSETNYLAPKIQYKESNGKIAKLEFEYEITHGRHIVDSSLPTEEIILACVGAFVKPLTYNYVSTIEKELTENAGKDHTFYIENIKISWENEVRGYAYNNVYGEWEKNGGAAVTPLFKKAITIELPTK